MPGKANFITIRKPWSAKDKASEAAYGDASRRGLRAVQGATCKRYYWKVRVHCASLPPPQVLLVSQMSHNVCGCRCHANVILLLESLHRKRPSIPLYSKEFLISSVCVTSILKDCMIAECDKCGAGLNCFMLASLVGWVRWMIHFTGICGEKMTTATWWDSHNREQLERPVSIWRTNCEYLKNKLPKCHVAYFCERERGLSIRRWETEGSR